MSCCVGAHGQPRLHFVKKCPVADKLGVAVGLGRGAPLMNLFKANQPAQSEEDRARDLRLNAIASRYRPEQPLDLGEPAPESAPSPDSGEPSEEQQ
jgi:hypothetical protein